jgi:very-short-patch-repair endonuclease
MPKSELTPRARGLRENQTGVEGLLWGKLRNRQLGGWKWKRQVPKGPYIVDFVCVEAGLAVELDGDSMRATLCMTRSGRPIWRVWA